MNERPIYDRASEFGLAMTIGAWIAGLAAVICVATDQEKFSTCTAIVVAVLLASEGASRTTRRTLLGKWPRSYGIFQAGEQRWKIVGAWWDFDGRYTEVRHYDSLDEARSALSDMPGGHSLWNWR